MKLTNVLLTSASSFLFWSCHPVHSPEKPNIVWICTEDITTMLSCYGDPNGRTPHLDAFAEKSVKFTNAFATAPVCSPSRSCIITGEYATSLGTQHLRSETQIPESVIPFPKLLKKAGYYVSNNDKEDYNFEDNTIWNESSSKAHWKNREEGQPFFSVFNINITHQSGIFGNDSVYTERIRAYLPEIEEVIPENLVLPPYFPESPVIRKLWARYYTNLQIMDLQFAARLKELEEEGLLENTIVFFFSDHGTGMPRAKRAVYDSGLKIPLLIYVPEKYAEKFNMKAGTVNDHLVNFLDFAPAILEIAGAEIPQNMRGKPFISEQEIVKKEYVFGTSDRVDEAYETTRTIRTKKYRYIRNFLAYTPLIQPNFYSDKSEIMQEIYKFRNDPGLTPAQKMLFAKKRQPEELYDVENDPHEINNLAGKSEYQSILEEMRDYLRTEILESYDTGLMPEPEMIRLAQNSTPYEITKNREIFPVDEILDACDLMIQPKGNPEEIIRKLSHPNGFVRYWAVVATEYLEDYTPQVLAKLEELTDDTFETVQIEAAKTLIKSGRPQFSALIIEKLEKADEPVQLFAARAFEETWQLLPEFPEKAEKIYRNLEKQTAGKWYGYDLYAFWSLSQVFQAGDVKVPEEVNYGNK
jgi:N-sulfoglucosamine sulfohydrolase